MLNSYSSTISTAIWFFISGSRVFFNNIPQYPVVQCKVCVHLLQLPVLLLQFLQSFDLAYIHITVF